MVEARIKLMSIDDGGRNHALPKDVKFGCPLKINNSYFDARFIYDTKHEIKPGDTFTTELLFLSPDLVLPQINVGTEFELWEGKIIGYGQFTKI
ncbi:MAG: hypothetical protein HKN88_02910 [Gammaproteobacteria bacterium]|nr:hypothetical protein [Gammaproteobacteria bacterium]